MTYSCIDTKSLLFTFLLLPLFGWAQYTSDFEKETLERQANGPVASYDLFHAIDYDQALYEDGKERLKRFIETHQAKGLEQKPMAKRIKTLYKAVHAEFLKKYEEEAFFNDIFESGNYNCVTASALYALVFDEFDVNYSIMETPNHVYLIADTLGQQTLVETTLPGSGVVTYNDRMKKAYIDYLLDNKMISDKEYKDSTIDELFLEYYSQDKRIDIDQLAGIQYLNKGIFRAREEDYREAVANFDKSLLLYPSTAIRFNHSTALQSALIEDHQAKTYDAELFGNAVLSSLKDSSLVDITYEYFVMMARELCVQSSDMDRFHGFYRDLTTICPEEDVPTEIRTEYHYFNAYNNAVSSRYIEALREARAAHELQPENLIIKEMIQDLGIDYLFIERNYRGQIDSMEYYFDIFPFLIQDSRYQQQYVYYHMRVASDGAIYDQPKVADEYYGRFLEALENYDLIHFSEEHISIGLSAVAASLAERNRYSDASAVIDQGLDLVPQSMQLQQLKTELIEYRRYRNSSARASTQYTYSSPPSLEDELKRSVDQHFKGTWRAVSIVIEDMEQDLNSEEVFEFVVGSDKDCIYTKGSTSLEGKWAYRPKSKCIYFVPDINKDAYKVFKVKEATPDRFVLLPYKDHKTPSPYRYVLKQMR